MSLTVLDLLDFFVNFFVLLQTSTTRNEALLLIEKFNNQME